MKTQNAYNAILNGNILITTVVGIINRDNTRKVFNQLKVQIPQLDGAPWGNLVDVRQWGLSSADINDSLVDLELWVRKHGRTHLVFVMGTENAGIKKFTLEQYLGNNLQKEKVKLVETKSEALTWLGKSGFHLAIDN
ncbi:hypothetical protein [Paraglaciecola arctica]|uniref:STAS/SEC14 domain-containing protein n=1 Tax=Paraglaciecola arctica BSs20135 TaxID=493475 RepID=K6XC89_9ALTE|nr:hypothetical protein [Paraglaciecola arctica]GAC18254.1 hypothetical protein GARC_1274 [Paraglaciecola arctica BSs20135]